MSLQNAVIRFSDFTDPDHPDTQRLVDKLIVILERRGYVPMRVRRTRRDGVRTITVVGIPAPGGDPFPTIPMPAHEWAGAK